MSARLLSCFFIFFLTSAAFAEEGLTPVAVEGGRVITVDEARAWFNSGKAQFVDVRNPLNYGRGHIPSAIAAPIGKSGEDEGRRRVFLSKLPTDKDAPLIFYSHGNTGWKSYRAAVEAVQAGYANVMWMREGFTGWQSKRFAVFPGPEND